VQLCHYSPIRVHGVVLRHRDNLWIYRTTTVVFELECSGSRVGGKQIHCGICLSLSVTRAVGRQRSSDVSFAVKFSSSSSS
jgi:hypothetical protein